MKILFPRTTEKRLLINISYQFRHYFTQIVLKEHDANNVLLTILTRKETHEAVSTSIPRKTDFHSIAKILLDPSLARRHGSKTTS